MSTRPEGAMPQRHKDSSSPRRYGPRVQKIVAAGMLAGVIGLLGLGCKSALRSANPEVPLWRHRPGGVLSLEFQQQLSVVDRRAGEAYEHGRPTVDVAHHRVFVGSSDFGLYALRAEDGTQLWRFETGGPVQTEPLYDPGEDAVYFGSDDGALYKVAASDGRLLWRYMSNAEVTRSPVLWGSTLLFSNANDTLVAVEAKTGKTLWSRHRSPVGGMQIAGYAGPAVWRGRVYVAYSDGNVMCYQVSDGASLWDPVDLSAEAERETAEGTPTYFDVDTTPVIHEAADDPSSAVVYVASYEAGVFGLDAVTGTQVWSQPEATGVSELVMWSQPAHRPRGGGPVVPARRLLIASSGTTGIWALDPGTGKTMWHRKLRGSGASRALPLVGTLVVATSAYGMFVLSPLDGGVIDGVDLGMSFSMAPAGYGTRAFVLSDGGSWLSWHITPPVGR